MIKSKYIPIGTVTSSTTSGAGTTFNAAIFDLTTGQKNMISTLVSPITAIAGFASRTISGSCCINSNGFPLALPAKPTMYGICFSPIMTPMAASIP